uniref:(northern house mosquito) hypothetical protein n=1 Tax=Culex pipiens TaxID=7175 RepID=A0A8D8GNU0_CULPI
MLPGRSARDVPVFAVHAEAGKHHRLRVPPVRRNWAVFQLHRDHRGRADAPLPQPAGPGPPSGACHLPPEQLRVLSVRNYKRTNEKKNNSFQGESDCLLVNA